MYFYLAGMQGFPLTLVWWLNAWWNILHHLTGYIIAIWPQHSTALSQWWSILLICTCRVCVYLKVMSQRNSNREELLGRWIQADAYWPGVEQTYWVSDMYMYWEEDEDLHTDPMKLLWLRTWTRLRPSLHLRAQMAAFHLAIISKIHGLSMRYSTIPPTTLILRNLTVCWEDIYTKVCSFKLKKLQFNNYNNMVVLWLILLFTWAASM